MNFSKKSFKTTERPSLAVCGSFCWRKKVFVNIHPLYWFDQKQLFKQSKFSLGFSPFKHGKKKNF